jgi:hypothetical protein
VFTAANVPPVVIVAVVAAVIEKLSIPMPFELLDPDGLQVIIRT